MKTQNKNGWVYLLESNDYIKVGMTIGSFESRLSNYRTHNPHEIKVLNTVFVMNPLMLEESIQKRVFSACEKGHTDWIKKDMTLVESIIQEMNEYRKDNSLIPDVGKPKRDGFVAMNVPFTQVANCVLNDKNLTARAKGLYAYLYSKPDDWDFSYIRIARDHKESKNTILLAIQELEKSGYLQRRKLPNGRTEYLLTYEPVTKDRSQACDQTSVRPKIGTLSNTELDTNKDKYIAAVAARAEKGKKNAETSNEMIKTYDFDEYLKSMEDNPSRHIQVIAFYFKKKKLRFKTLAEVQTAIRRHLRAAREVANFDDDAIVNAYKKADREYPGLYTVETLLKILTR